MSPSQLSALFSIVECVILGGFAVALVPRLIKAQDLFLVISGSEQGRSRAKKVCHHGLIIAAAGFFLAHIELRFNSYVCIPDTVIALLSGVITLFAYSASRRS